MEQNWERLQSLARGISQEFPDAVFIGGVAVAQHAKRSNPALEESSHDADLYLSLAGKNEMRDRYEVVRNERLGKDSVLVDGEDFDLYVERQHRLAIPYDEIAAHSQEIEGIRVAALEHLLVLKLDAAGDRRGSAKGEKDLRDLARLVSLLRAPRKALLAPHLDEKRLELLDDLGRRRDIFQRMGLNPHDGSRLRRTFDNHLAHIRRLGGHELGGLSL
ncbi:MAG: hypothetical protein KGM44_04760 [bacterium]|nr:hypothetical protein [bacterium]